MTEQGFHLEGFLRSLQPQLGSMFALAIFILIVYALCAWAIKKSDNTSEEKKSYLRVLNWIVGGGTVAALAIFFFAVLGRMEANRLPRSDVDKTDVYEQMESHQRDSTN